MYLVTNLTSLNTGVEQICGKQVCGYKVMSWQQAVMFSDEGGGSYSERLHEVQRSAESVMSHVSKHGTRIRSLHPTTHKHR